MLGRWLRALLLFLRTQVWYPEPIWCFTISVTPSQEIWCPQQHCAHMLHRHMCRQPSMHIRLKSHLISISGIHTNTHIYTHTYSHKDRERQRQTDRHVQTDRHRERGRQTERNSHRTWIHFLLCLSCQHPVQMKIISLLHPNEAIWILSSYYVLGTNTLILASTFFPGKQSVTSRK